MVKEVDQNNFKQEVLQADKPVLVDFWAPWCGPCRMMAPILESVANDLADLIKVAKINTDENEDLSIENRITGIPCLILYKNGKEIERYVGVQPGQVLEANIKKHLS